MRKRATAQSVPDQLHDDQLQLAFAELDKTGERLDQLKAQKNLKAKDSAQITKEAKDLKSTVAPPAPIRPPPLPTRYSTVKGTSSLAIPKAPPRPDSKDSVGDLPPVQAKKTRSEIRLTKSGRYFLQISDANDAEILRKFKDEVSPIGRIVDSGVGTASNPTSGWVEVAVRAEDTGSFIIKLDELQVKDRVEKVIEIDPGEGRIQAKQLDLDLAKSK